MLYYIRHGSTDWNEFKNEKGEITPKCQGRADIPLNENGRTQARVLAEKLKNVKFDKVYCSPLSRTKETCEIVLGGLDGVIFDNRILERDFGEFEGLTRYEFNFEAFTNDDDSKINYVKAEKVGDVKARLFDLLEELKQTPNQNVLIVSHGGIGCLFKAYFDGMPENGDYFPLIIKNGEVVMRDFNK